MKLGEVSPEMMEVGLWALAGHIGFGEMKHVDQEAMLRGVYHAMRWTEGGTILTELEPVVRDERERCATIAEGKAQQWDLPRADGRNDGFNACMEVAEAIRSTGFSRDPVTAS